MAFAAGKMREDEARLTLGDCRTPSVIVGVIVFDIKVLSVSVCLPGLTLWGFIGEETHCPYLSIVSPLFLFFFPGHTSVAKDIKLE